ncbi:hypothetical protein D3C76_833140 [compost metagenome]
MLEVQWPIEFNGHRTRNTDGHVDQKVIDTAMTRQVIVSRVVVQNEQRVLARGNDDKRQAIETPVRDIQRNAQRHDDAQPFQQDGRQGAQIHLEATQRDGCQTRCCANGCSIDHIEQYMLACRQHGDCQHQAPQREDPYLADTQITQHNADSHRQCHMSAG